MTREQVAIVLLLSWWTVLMWYAGYMHGHISSAKRREEL